MRYLKRLVGWADVATVWYVVQVDVWGNPLTQSWMQHQQLPVAPPPGQLPMSMWDINPCEMKTEQQILLVSTCLGDTYVIKLVFFQ
jgi:hypothetical protein